MAPKFNLQEGILWLELGVKDSMASVRTRLLGASDLAQKLDEGIDPPWNSSLKALTEVARLWKSSHPEAPHLTLVLSKDLPLDELSNNVPAFFAQLVSCKAAAQVESLIADSMTSAVSLRSACDRDLRDLPEV